MSSLDKTGKDERSRMLGRMDTKKLLIRLAIPAIVAMMVNSLYNLVDTIFIAWGASEVAIGALAVAFPVQMIVLAIGIMVGIGSASVFSRAYGRDDEDAMLRTVNSAIVLNLFLSVMVSVLTFIFLDELLRLFAGDIDPEIYGRTLDYARDYLTFILVALPPFSLSIVMNNLTRAEGRPKIAMISLILGAALNIVLDPIFIFDWGLGLGVRGAALATAVSKTVSFLYVFNRAMQPESALTIQLKKLHRLDFRMMGEITAIGMPTFVRNTLGAVLVIIVNNLITTYAAANHDLYLSIYGVITRLIMFSLMPGFGLVQGLQPIVGFNYGATFYRRVHEAIAFATRLLFGYMLVVKVLILLFSEQLFWLFSDDRTGFFVQTGANAFSIVALGFSMITFQIVLSSVYQALGYPVRAFFVALSRQFLLFIPISFILAGWLGIAGVWLTFLVSDATAGLLSMFAHYYEMYDLRRRSA